MDDVSSLILGEQPKIEAPKSSGVNTYNVGNLRPVGQSTGFQQMKSPEEGLKAVDDQLRIYGEKHGIKTLRQAISRWAPPSENDTESYIKNVAQRTGINPDAEINFSDPVIRHIVSGPIILQEKGLKNLMGTSQSNAQGGQQSSGDEVSNLILGGTAPKEQPAEQNPQGFVQELKKPLSEMSWEGFKKQSLIAPAVQYTAASLGIPGFTEQDKQAAQENLIAKGKGALKGAEQFIRNPVETAKAIGTEIVEHPGKVIGETIKGSIYDPELALIPGSVVTKPLQKGIAKAGEVISPAVKGLTEQFAKKEATMAGVGAAEVPIVKNRIERAKELPIPIELSKDQATRNPADVRFARETAKDPVLGGQLQAKYAEDNAKIQANLDKFVHDTGAEYTGVAPGELGQMLVNTIEPVKKARYAQIENAYNNAREAGHMNEPIDINKLENYVEKHRAEAINAPVLSSVEQ